MQDYTLLRERFRVSIPHFDPSELFDNLHTIIHENSNNEPDVAEHFEYEQELDKSLLSRTSVIGLGFGLMSPVLGMCTSMGIGLLNGGPFTIMFGFQICGVFSFLCACSLGEVVSKFPMEVHGASAMLAPEKVKRICSWLTGWFLLLGNWFMSVGVTFAGAQLIISLIAMANFDLIAEEYLVLYTVLIYYAVVTVVGVINLKYSKYVEVINKVCIYWIIYAVLFIDVLLLLFHRNKFRSLPYALFHFDNELSGYSSGIISFIIGFQQSNFTLQGFSMLPALADEVKVPEKDIPRGMSSAVLISTTIGIIFLFPIMVILPDPGDVFSNHKVLPIVNIFKKSTDSQFVSIFLVLLILGNLFFSGIGSITTSSRAVYSFSRDHAIPYYRLWTYVDPQSGSRVPKYSILLSMAVAYVLGLLPLFSNAAFNAFIGCAVLCLCSATLIPLVLVLVTRRRVLSNAPVKIKYKLGWIANIGSVLWLLLSMFSVCLPPQIPVTAKTMNYALVVFLLSFIIICVLYYKWGRQHFQLPQVDKASIAEEMGTVSVISVDQPPPLAMDVPQQKDDLPDDESPNGNTTTADIFKVNDPPVKNDS
ncbi:TPO5 (YKL174C) [Zygosaccharomyces parabailii]|nr:TPO5 (YKL174C) [Zygosaccharomyces parabailii]CDH16465.1 related to Polyamine transporter TPO5 [Zygosaccharomyces bailii ISA1307]